MKKCLTHLAAFAVVSATAWSNAAYADSETDRLREALRSATAQTRQLEDQRTALQAKVADGDREKAAAKAQVDAAKAEVRKIEKQQRETIEEFNKRLTERDETLEKWKAAYEEAATAARTKDAERARFESEASAYKASTKQLAEIGLPQHLGTLGAHLLDQLVMHFRQGAGVVLRVKNSRYSTLACNGALSACHLSADGWVHRRDALSLET
jgi:hypothetical protein